jgi:ribosome hibernation promoting factor
MDISVTGRKVDIGESLKNHIIERLNAAADKYFNRSIGASVTVSKEAHLFMVDCHFHASQGVKFQSRGSAEDVYAAFDEAAEKVEKQLRRYKRRIKNHHVSGNKNQSVESELGEAQATGEQWDDDGSPADRSEVA